MLAVADEEWKFAGIANGRGFVKVPNEIFDEGLPQMTGAEIKVVLAALRLTLGWRRDCWPMSDTLLCQMTGLSRAAVQRGLHLALEHQVLERLRRVAHGTYVYRLRATAPGTQLPLPAADDGLAEAEPPPEEDSSFKSELLAEGDENDSSFKSKLLSSLEMKLLPDPAASKVSCQQLQNEAAKIKDMTDMRIKDMSTDSAAPQSRPPKYLQFRTFYPSHQGPEQREFKAWQRAIDAGPPGLDEWLIAAAAALARKPPGRLGRSHVSARRWLETRPWERSSEAPQPG